MNRALGPIDPDAGNVIGFHRPMRPFRQRNPVEFPPFWLGFLCGAVLVAPFWFIALIALASALKP